MNSKLARWCDGFLEAGWLVALIVTPLFFNIHSERVFEPDKLTLVRSIATLMLVIWVVKFVDQKGWQDVSWLRWRSDNSVWRKPLMLPMLVIVLVYLISNAFSVAPRTSWFGSYQRLQGTYSTYAYIIIFALIVSTVRTRAQIERIVTVMIVTSIPVALYGLLQRFQLDPLPWGGDTTIRIAGHMGNSIFVAAYLILSVPITAGRIIDSFYNILTDEELSYADVVRSSIYILALAIQAYAIYSTQSRGPIIGLAIGMFAFVLILLVALRNVETEKSGSALSNFLWPLMYIVLAFAALFISDLALPSLGGERAFYLFASLIGLIVLSILVLAAARIGWGWLWSVWLSFTAFFLIIMLTFSAADQFPERTQDLPVIGSFQDTFEAWGDLPTMNRIGQLLNNNNQGTAQVRILIWQGAVELLLPHEPLAFSAEDTDRWNFLRPLIGYGPESMYVAYNRFYPPELANIEARNASPDRSHNETFDALIITGVIGFIAWQVLYISTFYYGLRHIGVIRGKRDRNLMISFWIIGAVLTTIVLVAAFEALFIGVSIPFGGILGLIVYFIYYALSARRSEVASVFTQYDTRTLLMAALVASLIAYYVEIHFGIAIAATRVYAFALMGLIVVVGASHDRDAAAEEKEVEPAVKPVRRLRSRKSTVTTPKEPGNGIIWGAMLVMTVLFGTLAFDFINFTPRPGEIEAWRSATDLPSSFEILHRALFLNPRQDFVDSPYLFGVLVLSWLFGTLLLVSEMVKDGTLKVRSTPVLADRNKAMLAAGLLTATALVVLSTFFQTVDPSAANSQRIARMLSTLWILAALSAAGGIMFLKSQPLARPFAGAIATLGLLVSIPTMVAGATLNGGLFLVLSVAILYFLWDSSWQSSFGALATVGVGSIVLGMMYGLIHAGLIRSSFIAPTGLQGLTRRVVEAERVSQYLTIFYGFIILTLLIAGIGYAWHWISAEKQGGSLLSYGALVVLFVVGLFFIDYASLNLIQADMTYKRGRPYDQQASQIVGQVNRLQGEEQQQALAAAVDTWDSAVAVYERTVEMAPNEDFYYLWLGRAYLEESQVNFAEQSELLDTAEKRLQRAKVINPLNTDHTANLARLNVRWAQLVDEVDRQGHINNAKGYYEDALALSPQNSIIRNEYGGLLLTLDNDCDAAIDIFTQSSEIDRFYEQTYLRLADTYLNCSGRDEVDQASYVEQAFATLKGIDENVRADRAKRISSQTANTYLRIAQAYFNLSDYDAARMSIDTALEVNPDVQPQADGLLVQIESAEESGE